MSAPTLTRAPSERRDAGGQAPPRLVAHGLTRRFGRVTVVSDVDLAVAPGEIHALIGANGAGKSTLLRMLAGLTTPTAGQVRVCGMAPVERRARARIGLLPSTDRGFYLRLSAAENLRFFGRMQGLSVPTMRRTIPDLLDRVGLAEAGARRTGLYSRGMLRRLAVARALLARPDVLLLDEATHDLDPEGSQVVRDLVAASGAATVWATQRLAELDGFADTISILAGGRQRYRGPLSDLVVGQDARFVATVLTRGGRGATVAEVAAALGEAGRVERHAGREQAVLVLPPATSLGHAVVALHAAGLDVRSAAPERPDVEQALLRIVRDTRG